MVQSGYFSIRGGAIVAGGSPQGAPDTPLGDMVVNDDLIVTQSFCVGTDCANGESFGTDTIRLKDDSLRVAFLDTSGTSSYPKNDWQIRLNESADGGANAFFIDDLGDNSAGSANDSPAATPFTIEAGAGDGAFYIDDNSRIGLGISTPAVHLHLVDNSTPTMRLEQSGGVAQTWDVGGSDTGFFVADVTNGSAQPLIIQSAAPTNTLYLASDGDVGIGTNTPTTSMELQRTGVNSVFQINRTDGAICKIAAAENGAQFGSATNHKVHFIVNNSTKVLTCNTDCQVGICQSLPQYPLHIGNGAYCSSGGIWTDASSREYKEDISFLSTDEAMATLTELCPVKFKYKIDSEEKHVGFIAEDVPELVATKDRKGMSPMDIVAVLTKVTQEQQNMLHEQQETIRLLEKRIARLEKE